MCYTKYMSGITTRTTATEKIPFAEFADQLTGIFDRLAREGRGILVERRGRLFRIVAQPGRRDVLSVRKALETSAGAFREIDRDTFLAQVRAEREQDEHEP